MLIGFSQRFANFVEEGSKTHTIRQLRRDGKVPRIGELLYCYVNPRQPTMRLIGRFQCVRVQRICFEFSEDPGPDGISIKIDGVLLSPDEREAFFYRDGFRRMGSSATQQALEFWSGNRLPWIGNLIHWKFAEKTA